MESTIRCPNCDQEIDAEGPTCPACGHIHKGSLNCERHPDRTAVGVCVVCGDGVCSECDAEDELHHACPDHSEIPVIEGWAQIYTTSDDVEADLIRDNLQSEGVDAAVLSQKDRSFNVDLGELSPVRVLVPAYAYLDAMKVLGEHMDYRGEVVFACPSCGEPFEPGETVCGSCGTPLPTHAA
ncbi:MAG TPA: zinc ribbon domain-containing protein [Longimicrobiales bacterium]